MSHSKAAGNRLSARVIRPTRVSAATMVGKLQTAGRSLVGHGAEGSDQIIGRAVESFRHWACRVIEVGSDLVEAQALQDRRGGTGAHLQIAVTYVDERDRALPPLHVRRGVVLGEDSGLSGEAWGKAGSRSRPCPPVQTKGTGSSNWSPRSSSFLAPGTRQWKPTTLPGPVWKTGRTLTALLRGPSVRRRRRGNSPHPRRPLTVCPPRSTGHGRRAGGGAPPSLASQPRRAPESETWVAVAI